jgi:alpha/beta superfamily hydrolase
MRRDSAKFVPPVLTIEHGSFVATNLLQEAETDQNFMEASPQVTRHRFTDMIRKRDVSLAVVVARVSKTEESA